MSPVETKNYRDSSRKKTSNVPSHSFNVTDCDSQLKLDCDSNHCTMWQNIAHRQLHVHTYNCVCGCLSFCWPWKVIGGRRQPEICVVTCLSQLLVVSSQRRTSSVRQSYKCGQLIGTARRWGRGDDFASTSLWAERRHQTPLLTYSTWPIATLCWSQTVLVTICTPWLRFLRN